MFDLNDSQLRALDLTQHVVLKAAAGSGKTSVLVERFVRILEKNGFEPRQIVALTFTEEAAREMRRRIGSALRDRAERSSGEEANPWKEVSRNLSQASITTIHGFCLQILQGSFERVGLEPGTRLLNPSEQPVLLTETIADDLGRASLEEDADLALLLDIHSSSFIQASLFELVNRRNAFRDILCQEGPYRALSRTYRSEAGHRILKSGEWRAWEATLASLPPELLRAPGTMSGRCREQLSWLRRCESLSPEELVEGVESTLAQRFSPSRIWKESSHYEPVKQSWLGLKTILAGHPLRFDPSRPDQDDCFLTSNEALRRLFHRVLESYTRAKQELRAIDFEDILDLARRLLKSPEVAAQLRRRYPFLLVDEFQDTNQVQWEILQALISPDSNFLAVGDDKQSIYRFRQAEVSVFRRVQRWVTRFGKTVEMPENYRSAQELVAFNNHVFGQLFNGGPDYEAVHQEMVARGTPENPGRVEVFFYEPDDPVPETLRVAIWIDHLVDAGRAPSEIAILLRTRNRLKLFEEALATRGIPFVTVAGAGFFESQEVLDAIVLLRWLADPAAEIPLLGLLRSPFFNFSDEQLLWLSASVRDSRSTGEKGRPVGGLIKSLLSPRAGSDQDQQARFARGVLSCLKQSAERGTSPSQLLRQAFYETGYEQILKSSKRADVRLGNLRKLDRLILDFERHRSRSLRALVRFLNAVLISGTNEPESEAAGQPAGGVRISTIHGAKGLEFPVVVLPELGVPFSAAPAEQLQIFTEHPDFPHMALVGSLVRNSSDSFAKLEHPHFRVLQKLDSYRQLAEEKRLLYVALTRSQEHLILLGRLGQADSFAGWLVDCDVAPFQVRHSFLLEPQRVDEPADLDLFENPFREPPELGREPNRDGSDGIHQSEGCLPDARTPAALANKEPGIGMLPSLKSPVRPRNMWSPTQITAFLKCPRRFYLAEIERIPEEMEFSLLPALTEAAVVGTAVHQILEKIPLLDDWPEVERLRDRFGSSGGTDERQDGAVRQQILGHLRRIRGHPIFDRICHAEESYCEREFDWQFGELHVRGVIDRLFRERSGRWVLLDFKTSLPAFASGRDEVQNENQKQLEIYLGAVQQILQPEELEGLLFFSANGHVERVVWDPELQNRVQRWVSTLPRDESIQGYPKTPDSERCKTCPFLSNGHCTGAAAAVQQTLW